MRLFFLLIISTLPAMSQARFRIHSEPIDSGERLIINTTWKMYPGDHPRGADPDFDDSDWIDIYNGLHRDNRESWSGHGWFRLHVEVDETLWSRPLGFNFLLQGAAELYINGQFMGSIGKVGANADEEVLGRIFRPGALAFSSQRDQLIAVRYSNYTRANAEYAGFQLSLEDVNRHLDHYIEFERGLWSYAYAFAAIYLAFMFFHLILYVFNLKEKANLYFALFNLQAFIFVAWVTFYNAPNGYDLTPAHNNLVFRTLPSLVLLTLLVFTLSLFNQKMPRRIWIFAGWTLLGMIGSLTLNKDLLLVTAPLALEIIRVVGVAMYQRKPHAWLIGLGVAIMGLTIILSQQPLVDMDLIQAINNAIILGLSYWGSLFLIICMSIYLSLRMANTSRNLASQLVEVKRLSTELVEKERREKEQEIERRLLEADNARKTQELEEARRFQLSMLPKTLPELPHIRCAASMDTATEVGGDYYDYYLADDGALIIAVGDAAGHGVRAGTMVAAVKGLFSLLIPERSIPDFFKEANLSLKSMGMKKMFMAMMIARFENNTLTLSAAGMPQAYLYRAETGDVEEILIKGLPLGGVPFPYAQKQFELAPGDTLLMMSDGLPELFNESGEMLDNARVREVFAQLGGKPPREVIEGLKKAGDDWRGQRPFDDDMTLMVVRMEKPSETA